MEGERKEVWRQGVREKCVGREEGGMTAGSEGGVWRVRGRRYGGREGGVWRVRERRYGGREGGREECGG